MEENETKSEPKTVEEMFVREHLAMKAEIEALKTNLATTRIALNRAIADSNKLKTILQDHCNKKPIRPNKGTEGKYEFEFDFSNAYSWDERTHPNIDAEIEYLKTFLAFDGPETEEETKEEN